MEDLEGILAKLSEDSKDYESSLDSMYRKETGSYYTDIRFAIDIINDLFNYVDSNNIYKKTFLEPCVGSGNFVFAYLFYCYSLNLKKDDYKKLIDNIYVCDSNANVLNLYKKNFKFVVEKLFNFSVDDSYFKKHIGGALLFDLSNNDGQFKYISINDVFPQIKSFDIIITNPPYKNIKAEKSQYDNSETYALTISKYKNVVDFSKRHFKYSSNGCLNLYKLFVEEIIENYLSENGCCSLLIPSSLLSDKTCSNLRTHIISTCSIKSIYMIKEDAQYTQSAQALCVFSFVKNEKTKSIKIKGSLHDSEESELTVSVDEILDESTGNSILALSKTEYEIRSKMLRCPKISELDFISNMRGELDLSFNKDSIVSSPTPYRLIRGRNILSYKVDIDSSCEYVSESFVESSSKRNFIKDQRLICQQIVNLKKKKRVNFALAPANVVAGNSCNFISIKENIYGIDYYYLLGVLNSSIVDWYFKLTSSNNHINNYEIDNIPIPINFRDSNKISELVKEYLLFPNDEILAEIDNLVCEAYGISNQQLFNKSGNQEKSKKDMHKNKVLNDFYNDLREIIPSVFIEDCDSLLKKKISVEELCFKSKFSISSFAKKVITCICNKYIKMENNEILNHVTFKLSDLDLEMIRTVPQGGSWKDIPPDIVSKSQRLLRISKTGGRTTLYGRIDYSKPVFTITTYFNRPGNGSYVHPTLDRVISVREAARFQSFPDDFIFYGNKSDYLNQVGNAVPVLLAYCIAKKIKEKTGCSKSVDLFSGAGGMTLGFSMAGIEAIVANDIVENACVTLKSNLPKIDVFCGDVTNEDTKKYIIQKGIEGKADIICGGPPCQGFSLAGFRRDDDPRNELFRHFIDIVSNIHPKVVVFENVEGILSYKNGETYSSIIELFSQIGYKTEGRILKANNYGVPQKRKRVIIICARNDLKVNPSELFPDESTPDLDKQITAYETIYDLENVVCGENATYSSEYTSPFIRYLKRDITPEQYYTLIKKD